MHAILIGLVLLAPCLLAWDVLHDTMGTLQSYLTLWMVCLSIVVLVKAW